MQESSSSVIAGNIENKSLLRNPISRRLVERFDATLLGILRNIAPKSIHEVGCGEGRLLRLLQSEFSVPLRGTELSSVLVEEIHRNKGLESCDVVARSIYDLTQTEDSADVVVCCEVLEHLDDPCRGLQALRDLHTRAYVLSVPLEPLWCLLNVCRGIYLKKAGNTPGHLQHWTRRGFVTMLRKNGFRVVDVHTPIPWTMVCAEKD